MGKSIEKIKEIINPILKEEGVLRSEIFGSYAEGTNNDKSDLDLLVEVPDGTSLLDLASLKIKLEDELEIDVDVVTYGSVHPLLKNHIFKHLIKVL